MYISPWLSNTINDPNLWLVWPSIIFKVFAPFPKLIAMGWEWDHFIGTIVRKEMVGSPILSWLANRASSGSQMVPGCILWQPGNHKYVCPLSSWQGCGQASDLLSSDFLAALHGDWEPLVKLWNTLLPIKDAMLATCSVARYKWRHFLRPYCQSWRCFTVLFMTEMWVVCTYHPH